MHPTYPGAIHLIVGGSEAAAKPRAYEDSNAAIRNPSRRPISVSSGQPRRVPDEPPDFYQLVTRQMKTSSNLS